MNFFNYTEEEFKKNAPVEGEMNLLISGTIYPLSEGREGSDWDTSSWRWFPNKSEGWMDEDSTLIGICINLRDKSGTYNRLPFTLCSEISFEVETGGETYLCKTHIFSREFLSDSDGNSYVYFKVDEYFLGEGNVTVLFKKSNDDFEGYTCALESPSPVVVSPLRTAFESSDFYATPSTVMDSVENTYTKKVELVPTSSVFYKENCYVELEKGPASIPDSYYTSIANISGRFLGTKYPDLRKIFLEDRDLMFSVLENMLISFDDPETEEPLFLIYMLMYLLFDIKDFSFIRVFTAELFFFELVLSFLNLSGGSFDIQSIASSLQGVKLYHYLFKMYTIEQGIELETDTKNMLHTQDTFTLQSFRGTVYPEGSNVISTVSGSEVIPSENIVGINQREEETLLFRKADNFDPDAGPEDFSDFFVFVVKVFPKKDTPFPEMYDEVYKWTGETGRDLQPVCNSAIYLPDKSSVIWTNKYGIVIDDLSVHQPVEEGTEEESEGDTV